MTMTPDFRRPKYFYLGRIIYLMQTRLKMCSTFVFSLISVGQKDLGSGSIDCPPLSYYINVPCIEQQTIYLSSAFPELLLDQ